MMRERLSLPSFAKGLSARLLVLTIFFVVVAEVLVFVPSVARFRLSYLEERLNTGHIAGLALQATDENHISKDLERQLLAAAEVDAVIVKRSQRRTIMFSGSRPPAIAATYDLRSANALTLIVDAFATLARRGRDTIHVIGPLPDGGPDERLEIILPELPLWHAMVDFSGRILGLTIIISLITAGLVYISLHRLMVRPLRRITESMAVFREDPENPAHTVLESARSDEIGTVQRELAKMQDEVRNALRQKTHLADLGAAISKITHDLRNSLANAQLVSERLSKSDDPTVRRLLPQLVGALDRAISLCVRTLKYGRSDEVPPRRIRFELKPLVDDIGQSLGLGEHNRLVWETAIDDNLEVDGDPEHVYRAIANLGRNAAEALDGDDGGRIRVSAERRAATVIIEIADNGPGLPEAARRNLFKPFAGSARRGGTGLGLAIARELIRAHGGDVVLVKSDRDGTTFRLTIPDRE